MGSSTDHPPPLVRVTLIELFVASLVVVMLFCAAVSWTAHNRDLGYRFQCLNNQRNLALATMTFDVNVGRLPGWAEPMVPWEAARKPVPMSWVFPILPYIERGDIFRQANGEDPAKHNRNPHGWPATAGGNPHIYVLVCRSDPTAVNGGMNTSYVANAGYRDQAAEEVGPHSGGDPEYDGPDQDGRASAVFLNRYRNATSKRVQAQSIDWISRRDGVANTLMFSENIHAGRWDLRGDSDPAGPLREGYVAFHFANSLDDGTNNRLRINHGRSVFFASKEGATSGANSFHPGGVVAAFCDGHTVFISQDIDWKVWTLLFTPDGAGLRTTWPEGKGAANVFLGMTLTERF